MAMTSFSASEMRPAIPVHSTGSRTEKLPFLRAVRAESRTFWSIPSCGRPSRARLFASTRDRFPSAGLRRSGGAVDEWGKPLLLIVVSALGECRAVASPEPRGHGGDAAREQGAPTMMSDGRRDDLNPAAPGDRRTALGGQEAHADIPVTGELAAR